LAIQLQEVDRVEILTLQDNMIDIAAADGSEVVQRAASEDARGNPVSSILAEHGFSAVVSLCEPDRVRRALFDFGFSETGALQNARTLGVDLAGVSALVLSHGHSDHHGGLPAVLRHIGRKGIELVVHPAAFRCSRYLKVSEERMIRLTTPDRERLEREGAKIVEAERPRLLLDGRLLFLGGIPRQSAFEKGLARARYRDEAGREMFDPVEDDSAVVAHVRGRGLVVLSGCAHAGIVNTVAYAREVTGVDRIFAIMGGFHLTGPDAADAVEPTIEALREFAPRHVVPTHCTGFKSIARIEQAMPEQFLLNMSGTRMVFGSPPHAG
jgi:7,8-dihydropterin-6-yl-methyl-4-(beta-D-ribofuranosyl)aminobenzene 5'-phosphate synthase